MSPMATNGARHTRTITDEQRDAILKANLIDRIRPSDIRKMAAAGTLGVPAFQLTTHVYTVIKRGRERFEATNDEALANSTRAELKRLHRLNLAKARKLTDKTDAAEIARISEALAKTERALGQDKPRTKPKPPAAYTSDTAPKNANVVADLLATAEGRAKSGSAKRAPSAAASRDSQLAS